MEHADSSHGTGTPSVSSVAEVFWNVESILLTRVSSLQASAAVQRLSVEVESLVEAFRAANVEASLCNSVVEELRGLCILHENVRHCRWRSVFGDGLLRENVKALFCQAAEEIAALFSSDAGDREGGVERAFLPLVQKQLEVLTLSLKIAGLSPEANSGCGEEGDRLTSAEEADMLRISLRSRRVLLLAAAALRVYIQANYTGPPFALWKPSDLVVGGTAVVDSRDLSHPDGRRCSLCCKFCHSCRRLAAVAACQAAAKGLKKRIWKCFCECRTEEDMPMLGRLDETAREASERLKGLSEAFLVDGEEVYDGARALPFLWLGLRLLEGLEAQAKKHAEICFKIQEGGCDKAFSRPAWLAGLFALPPPLSVFLWKARALYVWQRSLRGAQNSSGSVRSAVAPSLMKGLQTNLALSLRKLKLLPEDFHSSSQHALALRTVAELAGLEGETELSALEKQVGAFTRDDPKFVKVFSASELPPQTQPKDGVRLLLRLSQNKETDFACWLPDPEWMSCNQKALMLLELALRLVLYGRIESYSSVSDAACEAAGVSFQLTGVPGIRRKFQETALPQLVVVAKALPKSGSASKAKSVESASSLESPHEKSDAETSASAVCGTEEVDSGSREDGVSEAASLAVPDATESATVNSCHHEALLENSKTPSEKGEANDEEAQAEEEQRRRLWLLKDLNPDTDILERPLLSHTGDLESFESTLSAVEQALLLSRARHVLESNACGDALALEEVNAVVCRALVLPDPSELPKKEDGGGWGGELKLHAARAEDLLKVPEHLFEEECEEALRSEDWLVFSSGLWFRCKAEAHRSKTVERACLQLHALGDQSMDFDPPACYRLGFFFAVDYPSIWELKAEIARRMMRVGATITAAEKFEELQMWEEAADCLVAADRRADARALLETRIAEKPTPHLLCTLADIERSEKSGKAEGLYVQAWTISEGRYARAQRSLGDLYFSSGRLKEAEEAYTRATELNSCHVRCWFALGCCCMQLQNWNKAKQAFGRVVAIEPQEADAWANLSAIHSHVGAWMSAFHCVCEAVKHRRDSWRLWQNFCNISIRVRDPQSLARGMRELVEINAKSRIEPYMYSFLECAMLKDYEFYKREWEKHGGSSSNESTSYAYRQVLGTLQYLTQRISDSPDLFHVYSKLLAKAGRVADAVYASIKEFRTLLTEISSKVEALAAMQAMETQSNARHSSEAIQSMRVKQLEALSTSTALLRCVDARSARRNELLEQLKTTVAAQSKRLTEDESLQPAIQELEKTITEMQHAATTLDSSSSSNS